MADRGSFIGERWEWHWVWRRDPRGRELRELEKLRRLLEGFVPSSGGRDRVAWKSDPQGRFSVKVLRELIGERSEGGTSGGRDLGEGTIWLSGLPNKLNVFLWRAKRGRLPTREALDKLGIELDTTLCPRCGKEVETVNHALFACDKLRNLWRLVGRWWKIEVEPLNS